MKASTNIRDYYYDNGEMVRKKRIIFLDFDGVLNGTSSISGFLWILALKTHTNKIYRAIENIFHIDNFKIKKRYIFRLAILCKLTGAKVVLSSSWKGPVYKHYSENTKSNHDNIDRLVSLLKKYKIDVIGTIPHSYKKRRDEIITWLSQHEKMIDEFVILDDEYTSMDCLYDHLVITSDARPNNNIKNGYWHCNSGLKWKYIKQAYNILIHKEQIKNE